MSDAKVYAEVLLRDKGCVAPIVDPTQEGRCGPEGIDAPRSSRFDPRNIEREHVRPAGGSMGGRRITKVWAVVILCRWHHRGSQGGHVWALAHKLDLRRYLAGLYPERAADLLGEAAA